MLLLVAFFALLAALAGLVGCTTVQVVSETPAEFWMQAEAILWAICQDIWQVVEWLL